MEGLAVQVVQLERDGEAVKIKKIVWYFTVRKWWRDLVPWWVLHFLDNHFNVCWANLVMWKMLDSDTELGVHPDCGLNDGIPDGNGGWTTGFSGTCYCGHYGNESELRAACGKSAWTLRKKPKIYAGQKGANP